MNTFAELRRSIFLNHGPDDPEGHLRLARALAGNPADLDPVLDGMARLAAYIRGRDAGMVTGTVAEHLAEASVIRRAGVSPYIDRMLATALRSPDEPSQPLDGKARGGPTPAIAQSLFYGDPALPGTASGGGLGTLVRSLGRVLAQDGLSVLTLVPRGRDGSGRSLPESEALDQGHRLVRMPIALPDRSPHGFLVAAERIEAAAEQALREEAGHRTIVHLRYIDDASRAVASAARRLHLRLALTLTPDPHRSVCDPDGAIVPRGLEETRELFNRILIGDELLAWSDGLVGIGRESFSAILPEYFPQLEDLRGKVRAGIDEGVDTEDPKPLDNPGNLLCDPSLVLHLDARRLHEPAIICVGRLNALKGQANLARAWSEGPLRERWNLVFIGGDLDKPGGEERAVRDAIRSVRSPETEGRLCHLPSQDNAVVRSLLAWWGSRRPEGGGDIYVCPSLKEEFGLSILEAMAAGLPSCAPLNGGARGYLHHGVNGFLIDTRDASSLARELGLLLEAGALEPGRLEGLRAEAKRTVEDGFSLNAMAAAYAGFYRRMVQGKE